MRKRKSRNDGGNSEDEGWIGGRGNERHGRDGEEAEWSRQRSGPEICGRGGGSMGMRRRGRGWGGPEGGQARTRVSVLARTFSWSSG